MDRKEYWRRFWLEVGADVDIISNVDVYPLHPAVRYLTPGMRILECGCGVGRVVKHLAAGGYMIVGMDYEQEAIQRLHAQRPRLQLYVGDASSMPHAREIFDAVLAFGTFSNLRDPGQALCELHRVLRPGGWLVASVTNDSLLRRLVTYAGYLRGGRPHFAMVAYKAQEWRQLLSDHGFDVIELAPVLTRLPVYTFLPFLRASENRVLDWAAARDGDRGLRLNRFGEWLFRAAFKHAPFVVSHGVVAVSRKVQAS